MLATKYILYNPALNLYAAVGFYVSSNSQDVRLYTTAGAAKGSRTHLLRRYNADRQPELHDQIRGLVVYSVSIHIGEVQL